MYILILRDEIEQNVEFGLGCCRTQRVRWVGDKYSFDIQVKFLGLLIGFFKRKFRYAKPVSTRALDWYNLNPSSPFKIPIKPEVYNKEQTLSQVKLVAMMEMLRVSDANDVLTLDNKAWEAKKHHQDRRDKT